MKAKNCLLYLLQLCRLEFLLETLEVNLNLFFKVTFYYSQPFHKLPHSWELEAQAGDNWTRKKIHFFISLKEWHPNDFCRKERDLNQHFNIRSNWYLCLNWISFKSQNMILFCISESTVLLLILNKYNKQQKRNIYTRYNPIWCTFYMLTICFYLKCRQSWDLLL